MELILINNLKVNWLIKNKPDTKYWYKYAHELWDDAHIEPTEYENFNHLLGSREIDENDYDYFYLSKDIYEQMPAEFHELKYAWE